MRWKKRFFNLKSRISWKIQKVNPYLSVSFNFFVIPKSASLPFFFCTLLFHNFHEFSFSQSKWNFFFSQNFKFFITTVKQKIKKSNSCKSLRRYDTKKKVLRKHTSQATPLQKKKPSCKYYNADFTWIGLIKLTK